MLFASRAKILALRPDFASFAGQPVGVVAPWDAEKDGSDANVEVRGFITTRSAEDPVTGSLNARLGQWSIELEMHVERRRMLRTVNAHHIFYAGKTIGQPLSSGTAIDILGCNKTKSCIAEALFRFGDQSLGLGRRHSDVPARC